MSHLLRIYQTALFALALCAVPALAAVPNAALHRLFDDYWAFEMESDPFAATSSGVHAYNDRVPDVSPESMQARREAHQRFLDQLRGFNREALDASDALSADILEFILTHDVALGAFDSWRIPFLSDSGFHTYLGYVVSATPFENEDDYRAYLKRLEGYPRFLRQHWDNMRSGIEAGFTQPRAIMENILPSFDAQAVSPAEDHPLFRPFLKIPDTVDRSQKEAIVAEGRRLLDEQVIPEAKRLARFMREEYLPSARETLGAGDLPNGPDYYAAWVRYYTTLDDATPEQIHQTGLSEVKRIRAEMDAIIEETGFEGSFSAFLKFLRTDSQFYAKTPAELLMKASWIAKKTDGRLPAYFNRLPRQPYSVEPVPDELAPNYTGGRYSPAPPGSSRGGQYWVNTYALETRSLYQLPALTLHEGVPGHHLQIALAYEIENAPEFRTQFYPHAYGEGWGLYSEKLGVEMGIYETPYEHFGRLSYEMWRACRLVVDTGLHAKGWTREQAVDYLAANTALSFHTIGTEVDRYIAWPGQALAYKMGELTIWELRAKAESELGSAFDIRVFHDTILKEGGLPLELLRKQVEAYIENP